MFDVVLVGGRSCPLSCLLSLVCIIVVVVVVISRRAMYVGRLPFCVIFFHVFSKGKVTEYRCSSWLRAGTRPCSAPKLFNATAPCTYHSLHSIKPHILLLHPHVLPRRGPQTTTGSIGVEFDTEQPERRRRRRNDHRGEQ